MRVGAGAPTILVVGDRGPDCGGLLTALEDGGYDVLTADSGVDGLDRVRASRPDLVICNVLMPEMDGFEFVRALRSDPETVGVRVMFCTASFGAEDVSALASACGVAHMICEPCAPRDMLAAVTLALTAGRALDRPAEADDVRRQLRVLNGKLLVTTEELADAEQHAAELLALVEALQATAPVGLGLVDDELCFVRLNETLAALADLPADDQVGWSLPALLPGLRASLEPALRAVLQTGDPVINLELEGDVPGMAGSRGCWLATLYPVALGGELLGVGVVMTDITERRRQEGVRAAVREAMVEGVLVCTPAGTVMYMNPAASGMLGWPHDDVPELPIEAVIPQGIAQVQQGLATVHEEDGRFTCRDGRALPVSFTAAPLHTADVLTGSVVVFRDITAEKAEQLRVQAELEALTWLGRVRDALEEDRFVLYAQPVVSLRGETGGAELLLRMRSPSGEIIEPARFLPVAERFGLIVDIDRWVIARAIRLAARGEDVGVNLSARSLSEPGLLAYIKAQFEETGVDPANVIFEITETALMENLEAGQRLAEGLAALGSGIALDDFGTGFGTFTYLKRLPLRYLKIDAEFVKDLTQHPANRYLVKATVGLARDFGYKTIGEGVEDAETLALLDELGVDFVQGFHLAPPAPIAT